MLIRDLEHVGDWPLRLQRGRYLYFVKGVQALRAF